MDEELLVLLWKVRVELRPNFVSKFKVFSGDVSLSAEDKPPVPPLRPLNVDQSPPVPAPYDGEEEDELDPEHDPAVIHHAALRFLLAGGIAGASMISLFFTSLTIT